MSTAQLDDSKNTGTVKGVVCSCGNEWVFKNPVVVESFIVPATPPNKGHIETTHDFDLPPNTDNPLLKFRIWLNTLPIESDVEVAIFERVQALILKERKAELERVAIYENSDMTQQALIEQVAKLDHQIKLIEEND